MITFILNSNLSIDIFIYVSTNKELTVIYCNKIENLFKHVFKFLNRPTFVTINNYE